MPDGEAAPRKARQHFLFGFSAAIGFGDPDIKEFFTAFGFSLRVDQLEPFKFIDINPLRAQLEQDTTLAPATPRAAALSRLGAP